jgi:hypothetical protein
MKAKVKSTKGGYEALKTAAEIANWLSGGMREISTGAPCSSESQANAIATPISAPNKPVKTAKTKNRVILASGNQFVPCFCSPISFASRLRSSRTKSLRLFNRNGLQWMQVVKDETITAEFGG